MPCITFTLSQIAQAVLNYIQGVDFYAVNTDAQALLQSDAPNPIQIGELVSRGLGLYLSILCYFFQF